MNKTPFPILCSALSHALTGSFLHMLHIRIFFGFWMLYQSNSKVTPSTNTPFLSGCPCFTPSIPCYLQNPILFNKFKYCYRIGKTFIGYIEILLLKDGKLQLWCHNSAEPIAVRPQATANPAPSPYSIKILKPRNRAVFFGHREYTGRKTLVTQIHGLWESHKV